MNQPLESLTLEVKHKSADAKTDIDGLAQSLQGLKTALKGNTGANLARIAANLDRLQASIKHFAKDRFKGIAKSVQAMGGVQAIAAAGNKAATTAPTSSVAPLIGGATDAASHTASYSATDNLGTEQIERTKEKLKETTRAAKEYKATIESVANAAKTSWGEAASKVVVYKDKTGATLTETYKLSGAHETVTKAVYKYTDAMGRAVTETRTAEKATKSWKDRLKGMIGEAKTGTSIFGKLGAAIKRIAFYRAIRSFIRGVTSALKEGVKNIAEYSAAMNSMDASSVRDTLSAYKTTYLYIKNSLGAAVAPMLQALLPVVKQVASWFVLAANNVAQFFAALNGQSSWTRAKEYAVEYTDSVDDATKATKALKDATLGIDELNVISPDNGSGGASGKDAMDYSQMFEEVEGIDKGIQDFANTIKPLLKWVKDNFSTILKTVLLIKAGLLLWKVASNVASFFGNFGSKAFAQNLQRVTAGITMMIAGFSIETSGAYNIGRGSNDIMDYVKTAIGAALGVAGSVIVFGSNPFGWAIGIGLAITAFVTGFTLGSAEPSVEVKEFADSVATLKKNIEGLDGSITSDLEGRLQYARKLIDDIFNLDAIENKTPEQIADLKSKIDQLNNLELDGVKLTFNEFTERVNEGKDAVLETIDQIHRLAKTEALKSALVKAYEAKATAEEQMAEAERLMRENYVGNTTIFGQTMTEEEYRKRQEMIANYEAAEKAYKDASDALMIANNRIGTFSHSLDLLTSSGTRTVGVVEAANTVIEKFGERSEEAAFIQRMFSDDVDRSDDILRGFFDGLLLGTYTIKDGMLTATLATKKYMDDVGERIDTVTGKVTRFSRSHAVKDLAGNWRDDLPYLTGIVDDVNGVLDKIKNTVDVDINLNVNKESEARIEYSQYLKGVAASTTPQKVLKYEEWKKAKGYASGGYPTTGELFFAQEGGAAELVGRIGNKTAVVNNDQIVDAVSAGVYRAVSSAMGSNQGGGEQHITIELDGNVIYDNQQGVRRARGAQLVTNGVL